MAKTVAALFENSSEAYGAVKDLLEHGFAHDDISVMTHDEMSSDHAVEDEDSISGVAGGAGIGAALGGVSGLVLGLTALAVPGVGPVIAAGPLAAALIGAGVGAAAGGLIGALTDIGISEDHAHYFSEGMRRGGVLVTVATTDEMAERAESILARRNPIDLSKRAEEWRSSGWSRFDPEADPYRRPAATRVAETAREARTLDTGVHTGAGEALMAGPPPGPQAQTAQHAPTARSVADKDVQKAKGAVEHAVNVYPTLREKPITVDPEPVLRAAAARGLEAYEAGFRRHFTTTLAQQPGATYDMYVPAYRYGYTLATDTRYISRDWAMLETEAQRDWERDHPGTWERFKTAIRHAWEEVRGRR